MKVRISSASVFNRIEMEQAILILLHQSPLDVTKLIGYFQGKCDIFVHVDKDYRLSEEERRTLSQLPGVRAVYRKYRVHWGGFSILRTEMFLLREALRLSGFRYVHLLSGTDYPVKPLSAFLNEFDHTDKEYISCWHYPNPGTDGNTFCRMQWIFPMEQIVVRKDSDVQKVWGVASKLAKWGIKRSVPDELPHLFNGSQWFSISRRSVESVLKYTRRHPSFYRRMRFGFAPEETYINTVIMNTVDGSKVCDNRRYLRWPFPNAQHPTLLTDKDLWELATSDAFFARKIDVGKERSLVDKIDRLLLTERPRTRSEAGAEERQDLLENGYDAGLADMVVSLCKALEAKSVADLSCGAGLYVMRLRKGRIAARGFDGNPHVRELTQELFGQSRFPCERLALHVPLEESGIADMTLLIDVLENVPPQYRATVVENACRLARQYVMVSQSGEERMDSEELTALCKLYGYKPDKLATKLLRECSLLKPHKENTIFFRREDGHETYTNLDKDMDNISR